MKKRAARMDDGTAMDMILFNPSTPLLLLFATPFSVHKFPQIHLLHGPQSLPGLFLCLLQPFHPPYQDLVLAYIRVVEPSIGFHICVGIGQVLQPSFQMDV